MNKEYNDLLIENMKLKDKLEQQRKEYQETYKDVREEIKDYKKQLEEKDKIIDDAIDLTNYMIKELDKRDMLHPAETELLEILERGKNVNSK